MAEDPPAEENPRPATHVPRHLESLMPQVYDELHRLAQRCFRSQNPQHTLQPTALVHEAYLKLLPQDSRGWRDRGHFYCAAAQAMRHILTNHARDRGRQKRGGGWQRVPLEEGEAGITVHGDRAVDLLALDEALKELADYDERKCRLVELRYFAGLSVEETARTLEISVATAKRDWDFARSWLLAAMAGDEE